MKKLYLLLFIFLSSASIKAQNWQTVYSDRVQYFDSGVNAIKIISKQVENNGDSIFYNYPALYIDTINYRIDDRGTDSVSWLGKKIIIKPNGENHFINGLSDKMVIKTNATNSESWDFLRNSTTLIIATIDSVSYGTYNGITDSVKHISLSVVTNSSVYGNMVKDLHNKQIWLSKHNGFLRVPILEYILNIGWNHYYYNVKPSYNQTKINLFTNKNMFDFEVGDIVHAEEYSNYLYTGGNVYNGYGKRYYIDNYIDKDYDPIGDSVQYTINRRHFFFIDMVNPDTTYVVIDTNTTITQTYYKLSQQAFGIMPFSLSPMISSLLNLSSYGHGTPTEFVIENRNNYCNNTLFVNQQQNFFESYFRMSYTSRRGFSSLSQDASNGAHPSNPLTTRKSVVYVKNSCGEWGKDITLDIEKIKTSNSFVTIYPNPTYASSLIEAKDIEQVVIKNLQGKTLGTIKVNSLSNVLLNVSEYSSGLYLVEVSTKNGIFITKLIVK